MFSASDLAFVGHRPRRHWRWRARRWAGRPGTSGGSGVGIVATRSGESVSTSATGVATGVAVATVAAPGVGSAGVGLRASVVVVAARAPHPQTRAPHPRTRARAIDDAVAAAARARARRPARPPRTAPSARLPRRTCAIRWPSRSVGSTRAPRPAPPRESSERCTWATSPWASSPKPCSRRCSTRRSRASPRRRRTPVVGVQIAPDGAYAFAEMRTEKLSDAAMHLDGVELCSRAMRVGRPKGWIDPKRDEGEAPTDAPRAATSDAAASHGANRTVDGTVARASIITARQPSPRRRLRRRRGIPRRR